MLEQRYSETRVKGDSGKIVGLASPTYDGTDGTQYDLFGDGSTFERFAPGAFDEYLSTNPTIVCNVNHMDTQRLGKTPDNLKIRTDAVGLHYEVSPPDTSYARDLRTNLEAGLVGGSSLTFHATDVEWQRQGNLDIRFIKQAKVLELGPVYDPAYSNTPTSCRSLPTEERARLTKERDEYRARLETEKRFARIDRLSQVT